MEIIINRLKYKYEKNNEVKIIISKENDLEYHFQWRYFIERFDNKEPLVEWANENEIKEEYYISYEFNDNIEAYFSVPLNEKFYHKHQISLIAQGLLQQGFIIDFNPKALSLSCYQKIEAFNDDWDKYKRFDFNVNARFKEIIFNIGSQNTFISKSKKSIEEFDGIENIKLINAQNKVKSSKDIQEGLVIANADIVKKFGFSNKGEPINYRERFSELMDFYNQYLKEYDFDGLKFVSTSFESRTSNKVSFNRNKMVFKNGNTDINPITGMRNYGVFKEAPNATDVKFIFIYENNDDANNLYRYLKNGYKGFPGLERYVGIPLTLANAEEEGKYKRLQYKSNETLLDEFKAFEKNELPENEYNNLFALVIGDFDKDNPDKIYYDLKLLLLEKNIPSQFINYRHIRNSSVFNYHLPNIAIGIHAKLGGIPWRIKSDEKNELIIGFNQERGEDNKKYIAGSVFFDNQGYLKRTFSFPEKGQSELISELRNAVQAYIDEKGDVERIVIHYYKTLSEREKERIDKLLRENFNISVPFAVVEINDTKSRLELGFDPKYNFGMPVSGSFVKLSKREYLLFNNNRFKEVAPVGVKDVLPLKVKIHFADESGFSHKELIEQVYEFSRLIWKGLKQRSQPASCFYAKEIAKFRANIDTEIPQNKITQETPWIV